MAGGFAAAAMPQQGNLGGWLISVAGVTGRKLQSALSICDAEELDSVDDLRDLFRAGLLETQGFKAITMAKIKNALDGEAAASRAVSNPVTPPGSFSRTDGSSNGSGTVAPEPSIEAPRLPEATTSEPVSGGGTARGSAANVQPSPRVGNASLAS